MSMKRISFLLCILLSQLCLAQEWPASSIQTRPGSRWWWLGSAVTEEELSRNMDEIIIDGGYHSEEDVYLNVPREE